MCVPDGEGKKKISFSLLEKISRTVYPCDSMLTMLPMFETIPSIIQVTVTKVKSACKLVSYLPHPVYPRCNLNQASYSLQLHIKQLNYAQAQRRAFSCIHSCLYMLSRLVRKYDILGIFLAKYFK